MSTPDSQNIYVGAGEVWFNRFDANGAATQWRHLGDVSKLELTVNADVIEKKSSMTGARGLLARVVTGVTGELSMTLSEFDPENLALALLGTTAAFSQSSGSATDAAVIGTVKKGSYLDTGKRKIVVTGVKKAPSTALVEGTDYTYDSDSGLIRILPGSSTVSDGDTLLWSGTYPAIISTQVQALANAVILGSLRFRSASDAYGPRYLIDVWKVAITPDGALALLSDSFGEIGLKGAMLEDTSKPVDNRYFQAVKLN